MGTLLLILNGLAKNDNCKDVVDVMQNVEVREMLQWVLLR